MFTLRFYDPSWLVAVYGYAIECIVLQYIKRVTYPLLNLSMHGK